MTWFDKTYSKDLIERLKIIKMEGVNMFMVMNKIHITYPSLKSLPENVLVGLCDYYEAEKQRLWEKGNPTPWFSRAIISMVEKHNSMRMAKLSSEENKIKNDISAKDFFRELGKRI